MGAEIVGTLTHADARTGAAPRTAPHARVRLSRFTIDSHMKLLFACATHAGPIRVREQIRITLKML
jgi:hypothetical protein